MGQRLNQVLEAVENFWLYIVRLFDKDRELENRIEQLETEIEMLKNQETGLPRSPEGGLPRNDSGDVQGGDGGAKDDKINKIIK
ncbi:MAG: hypothetical protein Athens101410_691 [Parcubacteria group bacterium Athens1014_10]|nr:MAG: hypothetical protein Athens101410_691 [Parcubacteria group bacterium Athens1014_10]TSD04604.1 MAG: hypothetical protein Athens071412_741 [Parcubacteria group bacterium Athens0714_12]